MKHSEKPRILFISTAKVIGGGEIYLTNILPLIQTTYDCTLLTTRPVMNLLRDSVTTHRIRLFPKKIEKILKRNYRLKRVYYRLYFKRYLRKRRFDIINLQEFDGAFVDALDFKPIILTEQTRMFVPNNLRMPFKQLFEKIDRVVCVSRQTLDDVTELGIPKEKCIVIHNGIDTEKFKPSGTEGEYVTWVGRVEEEDKNPLLFLRIAKAAQAEGLGYKFRMIGDGSAMQKMRSYASENKLTNLEITGAKKPAEMLGMYQQAKILCLTSKTEGLPFVVLEAMACGVPVVSSNVGGLPEIIHSPKTGVLVDGFSQNRFLDEIKKLMEDNQLYRRTRQAGRVRVEQVFSLKRQLQQMSEQYEVLLDRYE